MGQTGGYQSTLEKLYALYKEHGFLCEDETLEMIAADGVSLVGINRITNKLIDMGVIFANASHARDGIDISETDENDRAQLDYESVFHEVLVIVPELKGLIDFVRKVRPPKNREWQTLIPQLNSGNQYAEARLFNMYLRVVINIALRFHKDEGIELDDAIQEGAMGLLRAIRQYDSSIHGNLGSYLPLWIRQYISRAIADKGRTIRLPVHILEDLKKIQQHKQHLAKKYGREPYTSELAQATELSADVINNILNFSRETISIDSLLEDEPDFDIATADSTFDKVIEYTLRDEIKSVLSTISDRERSIICLRFGMVGDREYTLEEIGEMYGVTRERIRQIEAKAQRRLRHPSRSKRLQIFLYS